MTHTKDFKDEGKVISKEKVMECVKKLNSYQYEAMKEAIATAKKNPKHKSS
jgi:uncharacterized membrane protein (DUF106 family)